MFAQPSLNPLDALAHIMGFQGHGAELGHQAAFLVRVTLRLGHAPQADCCGKDCVNERSLGLHAVHDGRLTFHDRQGENFLERLSVRLLR
jgi:hypothetical protein